MLVLTRRRGERIIISKDIVIEIVDMTANVVKIGITAPKEVVIIREELKEVPKK